MCLQILHRPLSRVHKFDFIVATKNEDITEKRLKSSQIEKYIYIYI